MKNFTEISVQINEDEVVTPSTTGNRLKLLLESWSDDKCVNFGNSDLDKTNSSMSE